MANYQTLTQINDLLARIDIVKQEKENLRSKLKNLRLDAKQSIYQYKMQAWKKNRIKMKSIIFKQNLLSLKEKELELVDQMREKYQLEIEKNFEFLIKKILREISIHKNLEKGKKENVKVICSVYWKETVENLGFECELKADKSDLFLQVVLPTKIYLLDQNVFISNLTQVLINQNLTKIAMIKIKQDELAKTPPQTDEEMMEELEAQKINQLTNQNRETLENVENVENENSNSQNNLEEKL